MTVSFRRKPWKLPAGFVADTDAHRHRRLDRRFAFVLNQTPPRGCRLSEAATSLNSLGVLTLSYVGQRNNHQDALGAGLGGVACGDNNEVQR